MDMQIGESRDQNPVSVIFDRNPGVSIRQSRIHTFYFSLFTDKIAILTNLQLCRGFTVNNVAF